MDSRPAYKTKKKVLTSHRRRISSILNQSPSKLNASKGDITRKINVLIKNNRTLAVALEDAQCELSSKQKLLEKASEYFKTIMLARVKMTQMWTALKSVLQDFDGTLEMLKCDNFKLPDISPPYQSSGKLKKNLKKIAQAVESVSEENSFLCIEDNKESELGSSVDLPISGNCVSSNFCPTPMEVVENMADKTSASTEPDILKAATKNSVSDSSTPEPIPPGSPCAKPEGPGNKEEMTPITSDSLIAINDTGTPKLSLPTEIPTINLKRNPGFAFSLFKEKNSPVVKKLTETLKKNSGVSISLLKGNDSSVKKFSKIPEAPDKPKSSHKVLNSRIPKFHAARNTARKETCLSDKSSKENAVCPKMFNKGNVIMPKEIDCRRKTFVVKNSDPETTVALNEEEVADTSDLENEQNSETYTNRKTFVVKSPSALKKKRKSVNNKRKTFVKKGNENNSPKSIKNKRGTFVLTDINENCTEKEAACSVNSECGDLVQDESNKPCIVTVVEALPPDSNIPCEITQNPQLSEKNCCIIDNPEMKNQQSNSTKLFPNVNSKETLKNKLENSSALEKKCRSVDDKRKTFVKKCDKNNTRKSIKNKRGTFVLTGINENCAEEDQLLTNLINSKCDDLVKEKLDIPCAMIALPSIKPINEALPSASNDSSRTAKKLQLFKSDCIITNKPGMTNPESNSEELLHEICFERTLKKNLENSSGMKDVNKLICNEKDTRVVEFDEKIGDLEDLKSTILLQNPSVELPVLPDRTTNETRRSTSEEKSSKEEKNNCTADNMECNSGNNSNRRETRSILSKGKDMSKIGTSEKEPVVLKISSQEPQVHCSNNAKVESERESVLAMKVNNNEKGKSSLKSKETEEKCESGVKHSIEGIEKYDTNLGPSELISDDEIIILDEDDKKRSSRLRKISYKMFLEPSYSDCESISEVENLDTFEDEISSYSLAKVPVRGKVSFSNKKNYVFDRMADAKIKPQKPLAKSKNCKNLTDKLTSASTLNRNCEDSNSNTDLNQISENVGTNPLVHFTSPKGEKTDPKRRVTFSDAQKTVPNTVKTTQNNRTNIDNFKIQKNSIPEILDVQNDKNVNKAILLSNYSPVISLDKCLNNIEFDMGNKKEKSDKINVSGDTKPKIQSIEADNNVKKQTDSGSDKTSKKKEPKRNQPKKNKKEAIESNEGKENVQNFQANHKERGNSNIQNNKAKNNKEKKLAKNNAIVVEAEIHPLPRTLNQLNTNISDALNYEVAVVLNDIFQSKKTDFLFVNDKENRDKNCISSPFTSNSKNIQVQATNKSDASKEGENEDLAECRRSKRARVMNYAEPALNKKMRR